MKDIHYYERVLASIRNLNVENITQQQIINSICDFGLTYDSRSLYSEYDKCMNNVDELGLWQRPEQLSLVIKYLIDNCNIRSFLEIGTNKASTFLILREYLLLKNQNLKSLTIDPFQLISNEIIKFFKINYEKNNINAINGQYDLVLIDGDHDYSAVKYDFEKSINFSPKYILFHDIVDKYCPGVVTYWNEIKNNFNYIEFKDCDDIMGLGLITL